jgi:hypothetical protein
MGAAARRMKTTLPRPSTGKHGFRLTKEKKARPVKGLALIAFHRKEERTEEVSRPLCARALRWEFR